MQVTPTVTFRGFHPFPGLEADVQQRIDRLTTFYGAIVACRVLVELAHRHHESGNRFHVRIELTVPGEQIVVTHEHGLHATAQDTDAERATKQDETDPERQHALVAVRQAFDVARRRLQDFARRQRGVVKRSARRPRGRVVQLFPDDGYGFIETSSMSETGALETTHEVYFQRESVLDDAFDRLTVGTPVSFVEEPGEKGPQASTVKVVHPRRPRRVSPSLAIGALFVAVALGWPLRGAAQQADTTHRLDNYYAASNRIDIRQPMDGDIMVAGRTVEVTQPVAGDIMAAGWHVRLSAPAGDDVRIAGGDVTLTAPVNGDLVVAGGDVTIGTDTHVQGRSWITGKTVRVDGTFERDLRVVGATVQLGGDVRQRLDVTAEHFEILPTARVQASITYKGSTEATIAPGAIVNGPIAFERIPQRAAREARAWPALSTTLFTLHLLIAGLLLLYFVPQFEPSVVGTLRVQPLRSFITGFAAFAIVPAAALALVVSVLALPLGLALGALYLIALFVGVLATAFFLGDIEARLVKSGPLATRGQHALLLVAGVLTLALLRLLFGGVIVFLAVLFGFGAVMLWAYRTYSSVRVSEVPAA